MPPNPELERRHGWGTGWKSGGLALLPGQDGPTAALQFPTAPPKVCPTVTPCVSLRLGFCFSCLKKAECGVKSKHRGQKQVWGEKWQPREREQSSSTKAGGERLEDWSLCTCYFRPRQGGSSCLSALSAWPLGGTKKQRKFMFLPVANAFPQPACSHWYGRSPVCDRSWTCH